MQILIGILIGIALTVLYRAKIRTKKAFFKQEERKTTESMWGDEFANFTTASEREVARAEYDKTKAATQAIDEALKTADKKSKKRLTKEKENIQKRQNALKKAVEEIDIMIEGAPPSEEYPQGIRGVVETLEAKNIKLQRLQKFIRDNC